MNDQIGIKILMITSEWPNSQNPHWVPFIYREVEHLRQFGVQVDVFPFRGGMRLRNYIQAWINLQRHLRHHDYHLIHAQFGQSGLLAIFPKRRPLVVTYRGSDLNGVIGSHGRMTLSGRILRMISQVVALFADEIILVSESLSRFLPSDIYHIIPSGIDLDLFRPQPQNEARQLLNLDAHTSYILFAGSPGNPIKRYYLAELAISQINNRSPISLLVAQGVPPAKMPLYINAADVLLLTSAHEGSPNMVKEALACNLPVVSVDVGDVAQRVRNVQGCIVCKDSKPETIADALQQVLQNKGRIEGRSAVLDLDLTLVAQKIINIYKLALQRG